MQPSNIVRHVLASGEEYDSPIDPDYGDFATWSAVESRDLRNCHGFLLGANIAGYITKGDGVSVQYYDRGTSAWVATAAGQALNDAGINGTWGVFRAVITSGLISDSMVKNGLRIVGPHGTHQVDVYLYSSEIEELVVYSDTNDGADPIDLSVGWTTDVNSYIILKVAKSRQHNGRIGQGYKNQATYLAAGIGGTCFYVPKYTVIEGFNIVPAIFGGLSIWSVIWSSNGSSGFLTLRNCIIDYNEDLRDIAQVPVIREYATNVVHLENCIIRGAYWALAIEGLTGQELKITGNLFIDNHRTGYVDVVSGNGIKFANNIIQDCGSGFSFFGVSPAVWNASSIKNIFDHAFHAYFPVEATNYYNTVLSFRNRDAQDYRLASTDRIAMKNAVRLVDYAPMYDMVGNPRLDEGWDIGPIAYNALNGYRSWKFALTEIGIFEEFIGKANTDFWIEYQNEGTPEKPYEKWVLNEAWEADRSRYSDGEMRFLQEARISKWRELYVGKRGILVLDEESENEFRREDMIILSIDFQDAQENELANYTITFGKADQNLDNLPWEEDGTILFNPAPAGLANWGFPYSAVHLRMETTFQSANQFSEIQRQPRVLLRGDMTSRADDEWRLRIRLRVPLGGTLDMFDGQYFPHIHQINDSRRQRIIERFRTEMNKRVGIPGALSFSSTDSQVWMNTISEDPEEWSNDFSPAYLESFTFGELVEGRWIDIELNFVYNFIYDASQW